MKPIDRYDSLLRFYAEWDRKPGELQRFVPRSTPVDWRLLKAIMIAESSGNPDAASPKGAVGLSQAMPATWGEWARQQRPERLILLDPRDPEDATWFRADYFGWLLERPAVDGDVARALAAYNWGIGSLQHAVATWGDDAWLLHVPPETQTYVKRVLNLLTDLTAGPR